MNNKKNVASAVKTQEKFVRVASLTTFDVRRSIVKHAAFMTTQNQTIGWMCEYEHRNLIISTFV